jgi:transposase-like zinc ribbon protein
MDTLDSFDKRFSNDDDCKRFLVAKRWSGGVRCPRCNRSERVYALKSKPFHWACKNADCGGKNGYRFSVLTHTIFQDTKVELKLWFKIGFLMVTAKKGISSLQLRRVIFGEDSGTDWRTCWYICHRWRAAMKGDAFPLIGEVEMDETYIGGKDRNRHWGKKSRQQRATAVPATGLEQPGEKIGYGKAGVIGAIEAQRQRGRAGHRRHGRPHSRTVCAARCR